MRRHTHSDALPHPVEPMPLSQFTPQYYDQLLSEKAARIQAQFNVIDVPPASIFASPPTHFRMRTEFRIWQQEQADYVMFGGADRKQPIITNEFPIASHTINRLMPVLRDAMNGDMQLRRRWYQAEFLSTTLDQAIVSLIYMRKLDDAWCDAARTLAATLGISLIGRSRGQRIVIGNDSVTEQFTVDGELFSLLQPEGAFTQPNASVNAKMLQWAVDQIRTAGGDLLELYCGIGNFTLPLSRHFSKVFATEVAKTATLALQRNVISNACNNIELARLSAALHRTRSFQRLARIDLGSYRFSTIFVDPPRAGLDDGTRALASEFDNILYISCSPDTLLRDAGILNNSHRIASFAIFDQFPYTHHAECGMLFVRK
jgi:tRNA (uracil-5-)-methyltransferase